MEKRMREIVAEVFYDLEAACAEVGESLDAESLADTIGDRMHDESAEYRATPWAQRRAMTLKVAQLYV